MGREHRASTERPQQKKTAATQDKVRPPAQGAQAPGPAMTVLTSPGAILALQRTIGNAAVNQLLRQQARAATTVQTLPSLPDMSPMQRHAEDEEIVQTLPAAQRLHAASAPATGADLGARIRAARGGGSALDGGVQRTLEAGLGASLSGVRVHTSGEADSLARSVQAVAFTTGSDIFFRSGAYNPSTPGGLRLLAHEATHTVQQAAGPVAGTPHPGGVSISDPGDSFERAAEATAARVTMAPGAPIQRHAEEEGGHVCTANCQHTIQRATAGHLLPAAGSTRETHVCGSHCHHTARSGAVVMRTAADALNKPRIPVRRTAGRPLAVQRHSSFEHKMLGDVSPDDLKVLASAANLNKQGRAVEKFAGGAEKDIRGPNNQVITRENVVHVLEQEIRRLNYFKSAAVQPNGAPMSAKEFQTDLRNRDTKDRLKNRLDEEGLSAGQARALINTGQGAQLQQDLKAIVDNEWQVRIVSLPSRDGSPPLLITYGEMNTLADLYGSPQEIGQADPKNRYQIVQGIRQQSIIKFLDLLREVKGTNYLTKKFGMHLGQGFDDAIGSTGRGDGPLPLGELRLMGTIPGAKGKKTGDADASQSYKGGLARNACHFAPESWHAWADYHGKARALATGAYNLRHPGGGNVPTQADLTKADGYENTALVYNGFGDHFLQDSYAAGHLINKTQVMQWFVKWLDAHPFQSDKESASEWRRMQPMAYNQPGLGVEANRYDATQVGAIKAKDPQSVENMKDPVVGGAAQGRRDRFAALGLTIPPSLTPNDPAFNFLVGWQQAAATNSKNRTMTVAQAIGPSLALAPDYVAASIAFKRLVKDDVARVEGKGIKRQDLSGKTFTEIRAMDFVLRSEYVPKNAGAFASLRADLGSANVATKAGAEQQYQNKALNTTYAQYHKFLNSTLLQASTNVLHDHFCKNGIEVETASGVSLGRIYGDDRMLGKDSAKGVQYSGETARMSRQTIFDLIDHGPAHPIPTITAISARFPTKAKLDNGSYGSLDRWHQDLETLCNDKIFPGLKGKVTGSIKNVAATLSSEVSPQVSKDAHPGTDTF